MKKIKDMIETSFTKTDAINMLNTFRTFGSVSEKQYDKGRVMINKKFK
jgi:hypothetical protein